VSSNVAFLGLNFYVLLYFRFRLAFKLDLLVDLLRIVIYILLIDLQI
jgi:hypothetical protein